MTALAKLGWPAVDPLRLRAVLHPPGSVELLPLHHELLDLTIVRDTLRSYSFRHEHRGFRGISNPRCTLFVNSVSSRSIVGCSHNQASTMSKQPYRTFSFGMATEIFQMLLAAHGFVRVRISLGANKVGHIMQAKSFARFRVKLCSSCFRLPPKKKDSSKSWSSYSRGQHISRPSCQERCSFGIDRRQSLNTVLAGGRIMTPKYNSASSHRFIASSFS